MIKNAVLSPDKYGNNWSAKIRSNRTQIWIQTRNGKVINGGLNQTPKTYNPNTGLSSASTNTSTI